MHKCVLDLSMHVIPEILIDFAVINIILTFLEYLKLSSKYEIFILFK